MNRIFASIASARNQVGAWTSADRRASPTHTGEARMSAVPPSSLSASSRSASSRSVSSRTASSSDIAAAIRFLVVLSIIGTVGAIKLAIASEAQQVSVQLDHARSEVDRSEIRRERLLMERAMLRQPGRLQAAARQLGLEAPIAVIDVPAAPADAVGQTP